uniref:hypothetical protein n=1 Tax=Klebsiella pneumoniae TaxID=573 RepID=UPI001C8F9680
MIKGRNSSIYSKKTVLFIAKRALKFLQKTERMLRGGAVHLADIVQYSIHNSRLSMLLYNDIN